MCSEAQLPQGSLLGPSSPSALPGQCLPSLNLYLPCLMVSLQRQSFLVEGPFFFFFFCLISHGNPCFYIELIVHVVQFSSSVMSNFLRPHGLQHTRLSSSSPTPRACSDSCALSHWCHPTISSSVTPFCSCLQSFPASGSLPMSQFFTSGVQSIGVSASEIPLELNGLISLQSKGLSRVFSNTIVQKHQFFCTQLSLWSHSHIHI